MNRRAGRILLTTLLAGLFAAHARAQDYAAGPWVSVAPPDEAFVVSMPQSPAVTEQRLKLGGRETHGRLYAVVGSEVNYKVWSVQDPRPAPSPPFRYSAHYDEPDELAWRLLVRPVEGKLRDGRGRLGPVPRLSYRGEIFGTHVGREYTFIMPGRRGFVDIYSVGPRLYIVAADAPSSDDARVARFLDSFGLKASGGAEPLRLRKEFSPTESPGALGVQLKPGVPLPNEGAGGPLILLGPAAPPSAAQASHAGAGGGGGGPSAKPVDYSRPFKASEVTRKAMITRKPEPEFTGAARRFNVTGLVKLRLLLSSDGKVGNVSVVKGLPHGLTDAAVGAARGIGFRPAEKDGRKVSQYIVIEYFFNIY